MNNDFEIIEAIWPDATITAIEGNPNILGWNLYSVANLGNGPIFVYVTPEGEVLVSEQNNKNQTQAK